MNWGALTVVAGLTALASVIGWPGWIALAGAAFWLLKRG